MTGRSQGADVARSVLAEYARFGAFALPAVALAWLFAVARGGTGPRAAVDAVAGDPHVAVAVAGFALLPPAKVVAGPRRRRLGLGDARFLRAWLFAGVVAATLIFVVPIATGPSLRPRLLADVAMLAGLPFDVATGALTVLSIVLPEKIAIIVLSGIGLFGTFFAVVFGIFIFRTVVVPALHGAVLGVVPAVLFTLASGGSLGTNLAVWAVVGGVVFTRLLRLDSAAVDDWAVYAAVGVALLAALVLDPEPAVVPLFVALGAGLGSDLDGARGSVLRPRAGVVSTRGSGADFGW